VTDEIELPAAETYTAMNAMPM